MARAKGKSQAAMILEHLKTGRTLTAMQALEQFGCFRLAARIYDLRKRGYEVTCYISTTPSGKWVAHYLFSP